MMALVLTGCQHGSGSSSSSAPQGGGADTSEGGASGGGGGGGGANGGYPEASNSDPAVAKGEYSFVSDGFPN